MTTAAQQIHTFYAASRNYAEGCLTFMDLVREGVTREELARNIERRPSLWSRYEGFLDLLPSTAAVEPALAA